MTESVVLTVTGMKCGGCEANVTAKLKALNGVIDASAEYKESRVTVEFDSELTTLAAIQQVIVDAGFGVS